MAAYNGTVELIAGLKQKNNGTFPLVNAPAVKVDSTGKRLDTALAEIASAIAGVAPVTDGGDHLIVTIS